MAAVLLTKYRILIEYRVDGIHIWRAGYYGKWGKHVTVPTRISTFARNFMTHFERNYDRELVY